MQSIVHQQCLYYYHSLCLLFINIPFTWGNWHTHRFIWIRNHCLKKNFWNKGGVCNSPGPGIRAYHTIFLCFNRKYTPSPHRAYLRMYCRNRGLYIIQHFTKGRFFTLFYSDYHHRNHFIRDNLVMWYCINVIFLLPYSWIKEWIKKWLLSIFYSLAIIIKVWQHGY